MLTYLHVQNFALIKELSLEIGTGLTVLTGETGAGKSILIGSMNAISGNKLDRSIIRRGEKFALIEMQFELANSQSIYYEETYGIPMNDDTVIILSRKYNDTGRSIYRANGMTVTAQVMQEIFENAIDIHSQHEHQSLLNPKMYLQLLDQYLGEDVREVKISLAEVYRNYITYRQQLNEDRLDDDYRQREMDFLRFEIEEISSAQLVIGEDLELDKTYKKLSGVHRIEAALAEVDKKLHGDIPGNISDMVSDVVQAIEKVKALDEALLELSEVGSQLESMIYDMSRMLDHYLDTLDSDPETLSYTEERLDLLNGLKQKYGDTIEEIMAQLDGKIKQLDHLENYETNIRAIKKQLKVYEEEILEYCQILSEKRKNAAVSIASDIEKVLSELNFNNNQVEIVVEEKDSFTAEGFNKVMILISTNKNEPLQPLNKIASGGELSRVMLALKSVFADMDQLDTLVFDEIDTGISGRTAQKVAEKMVGLAGRRQILCITHLPQIAAMADGHFLISKEEVDDHTETSIESLSEDKVINELSRLIGGAQITDATLAAAKDMKDLAEALKNN